MKKPSRSLEYLAVTAESLLGSHVRAVLYQRDWGSGRCRKLWKGECWDFGDLIRETGAADLGFWNIRQGQLGNLWWPFQFQLSVLCAQLECGLSSK